MRSGEIGSIVLIGAMALACSTKKVGGGAGGASVGGASAQGGAVGGNGGGGATGSDDGGGKDAPASLDGSSLCGAQPWTRTNWSGDSSYFRLYAGPDRGFARTWDATNGGRTFLTGDSGATWTPIGSPDSDTDFLSIVMWNNHVLAGTWNALYQSDSGGTSFNLLTPTGIPADTAIWSLAAIDATLLAGTTGGVYLSADNGATWSEVKAGIPANATVTSMIASGNGILAGTDGSGVLALPKGDTSWKVDNSVLASAYINQLAALDTRAFAVTPDGVFVSNDNGATWRADTSGLRDVNCLLVFGGRLWAGTDASGVYLSTDTGGTWTSIRAGMPDGIRVWSLAATSEAIFAGTSSGVWRIGCEP